MHTLLRETIESRSTVQRALDQHVRKYDDLTMRAPFGVVHVDSSCRYEDLNPALLRILNRTLTELRDQEVGTRGEPAEWAAILRAFQSDPARRGSQHDIQVTIGGSPRHLEVSLGRQDNGGQFAGFVVDRTQQVHALQEARRFASEARKADRAKSNFLAVMSHELRTPLNGVLGMADVLRDTPLKEDQLDMLDTIRSSADGLLTIINDILDFSKIESGATLTEAVTFELRSLLDGVSNVVRSRVMDQKIGLHLIVDPLVPSRLIGDPTKLRQVLVNLVGNAVKFTRKGGVTVHVQPALEGKNRFAFSVSDTGIGIKPESLSRIFESFQQEDASTTRRFGGTGLGLAISRGFVDAMGGSLEVESIADVGSKFSFTLGLAPASPATPRPQARQTLRVLLTGDHARDVRSLMMQIGIAEADSDDASATTISSSSDGTTLVLKQGVRRATLHPPFTHIAMERSMAVVSTVEQPTSKARQAVPSPKLDIDVLLVEDNEVNRRVALHILKQLGCRVTIAKDGHEGVERAKEGPYDIILMDIEMPGLDGYQAASRIREMNGANSKVAIIALSAHTHQRNATHTNSNHMDAYQTKPYTAQDLRDVITRTLSSKTND